MIDEGAAANRLSPAVIYGDEYLAAATDDIAVDVGKCMQVGFFQIEPSPDPFRIEADEIGLVLLAVCLNSYH